jgi:hypothetical protein
MVDLRIEQVIGSECEGCHKKVLFFCVSVFTAAALG